MTLTRKLAILRMGWIVISVLALLNAGFIVVTRVQASHAFLAPANQTDLSIGLDPPVSSVRAGERVVFNFRVENHSRVQARNVVVTVALPQGFIQESMFANGFWKTCTTIDVGSNAARVACTVPYFAEGRYAYITIPARAPDSGWPLPLIGGGAVLTDTPDYEAANNLFNFNMAVTP